MADLAARRSATLRAKGPLGAVLLTAGAIALTACGGNLPPDPGPGTSWSDGWWRGDTGPEPPPFSDQGIAEVTFDWTSQPEDLTLGEQQTIGGTVSGPTGPAPGQVELWLRTGATGAFQLQTIVDLKAGAWTHTATFTTVGEHQWEARYLPAEDDELPPASAKSAPFTVGLPQVQPLEGGEASHTSCSFSWAAVSGATAYDIYRDDALLKTVTDPASGTIEGLQVDTTYAFKVQAVAETPAGESVKGPLSAELRLHTGSLAATTDEGESDWIKIKPSASGSYRPTGGWGVIGDLVAQGYWTASYGAYYGVVRYAGIVQALKGALGANGADRFANGDVKAAEVWLYKRPNTGSYGSVTMSFYATAAVPNQGGQPATSGAKHDVASSDSSVGKWYGIGLENAKAIAKDGKNLLLHRNTNADYAQFDGASAGGDHCALRIKWAWSYERTAEVAPSWSTP